MPRENVPVFVLCAIALLYLAFHLAIWIIY